MNILFGQDYFIGNQRGGTEVYTHEVLLQLLKLGHQVAIFTLGDDSRNFQFQGIQIFQFNKALSSEQLKSNFDFVLREVKPDLYHQHTLSPKISEEFLSIARGKKIKVFFTAHLASAFCIRGSMIELGEEACDGELKKSRCLKCFAQRQGFNQFSATMIAKGIPILQSLLPSTNLPKSFNVFDIKHTQFKSIVDSCDKIMVFSQWQLDQLCNNHVPKHKVVKVEHAVEMLSTPIENHSSERRKFAFIGRVTRDKGLKTLIDYFVGSGRIDCEVHIFPIFDLEEKSYADQLISRAEGTSNIFWRKDFSESIYNEMDGILIPSWVRETGPLVSLEMAARGKMVIASEFIGNAELLAEYTGLFLFNVRNLDSLKLAIDKAMGHLQSRVGIQNFEVPNYQKVVLNLVKAYEG